MKILIGYDGSKSADAVLDELGKAGLPDKDVEALILTVAEIWMPPPINGNGADKKSSIADSEWIEKHQKVKQAALNEADSLSRHALKSLKIKFPGWKISSETTAGSPARKILEKAAVFFPDLIVLGAYGKNAINRLFLGSIAGKILSEAKCSVRVVRVGKNESAMSPNPVRIVIGFDGSPGAEAAIEAVIARKWGKHGEVLLVTAIDSLVPDSIGRFMKSSIIWVEEEIQTERRWIEKIAGNALIKLKAAGFRAELCVRNGNPKQILIEEAGKWHANCIFIGANSCTNKAEQSPISSISAAVAERALCSVEVVRSN